MQPGEAVGCKTGGRDAKPEEQTLLTRARVSAVVVVSLLVMVVSAGTYASAAPTDRTGSIVLAPDFGTDNGPVVRLYIAALDRRPDVPGLEYWRDVHKSGRDLNEISGYFVRSKEFQEKYGDLSDEDFVTLVYRNVLDRVPDAPGLEYWVDLLGRDFTRGTVLNGFAQSAEFVRLVNSEPDPVGPAIPVIPGSPPILMIGDSIFHGIRIQDIPVGGAELTFLTKESRQASTLSGLLDNAAEDGTLDAHSIVVIHLGTNGWESAWEQIFHDQMARLGSKRVFLVNTEDDLAWETAANDALSRIASSHSHVKLIDWNAEVAGHPEWLRPDGVHPTIAGLNGLAELVARSVTQI